jgi:PIN domain nuclease of toxin-antitoxin system
LRILLDTHILLWALIDPARLNASVRAQLEDARQDILFSAASIWEMSIKAALGRADFSVAPREILEAARATGFFELPVTAEAALRVAALPHHHRDPFDRLLVAQAIHEPARLFTADAQLAAYSELVTIV